MYSSCKRSIRRNTTWSAIYISLQRIIPKFDTVLLHSSWSSLRRKYLSKIISAINILSFGLKASKVSGITHIISPALHPQKSSQRVHPCAARDDAICSKNRKIVQYHRDSPNLEIAHAWLLILHQANKEISVIYTLKKLVSYLLI